MRNEPYVKLYDANGICTNPLEKTYPSNMFPNRRARRNMLLRSTNFPTNNKKGIKLIVSNIGRGVFTKYKAILQTIGNKQITHYVTT